MRGAEVFLQAQVILFGVHQRENCLRYLYLTILLILFQSCKACQTALEVRSKANADKMNEAKSVWRAYEIEPQHEEADLLLFRWNGRVLCTIQVVASSRK